MDQQTITRLSHIVRDRWAAAYRAEGAYPSAHDLVVMAGEEFDEHLRGQDGSAIARAGERFGWRMRELGDQLYARQIDGTTLLSDARWLVGLHMDEITQESN